MRHFRFNKIIRDKLPEIISQGGIDVVYKNIEGKDLLKKLKDKLLEETQEAVSSVGQLQIMEELADILEVIHGICFTMQVDIDTIEELRREKFDKRGGFHNGVYVDRVSVKDDSTMLAFYLDQPDKYPEIET